MKLSKYLADYVEHKKFNVISANVIRGDIETEIDADELQQIIQQGIEAFVSTSDVTAVIVVADSPVSEVYI